MKQPALLALADGTVFHGTSIGAVGQAAGEVVFNTAITGYQEILTDPSYFQQIVTLTQPHIGNVGTNRDDQESARTYVSGLVIRDLPLQHSSWRSEESLEDYLHRNRVVAIADIDSRRLTRLLRDKGAQNACIAGGPDINVEKALVQAREFPGLKGADLAQDVSTDTPYQWTGGTWQLGPDKHSLPAKAFKVVAYDYGIKRNILRLLVDAGCDLTVVPAKTPAREILAEKPDGVFLSNGPGDPDPCDYAIEAIREIIASKTPTFGICLGHQLLGLACGAKTSKMKFGHHGANHPVQDLATRQVLITSQNHGFAVDEDSLPNNLVATHRSLFDGTLQGVHHTELPAFGFQGHPEASPGPHDVRGLFQHFVELMRGTS
ncbi:MAG: glutamine-hydrolyzing carbamoyl-phosphate synthase small subunit [Gammaproteobacteria bacterium]|nr:glutamine-hydrolyzing carbamoyl-phosphate synthase small subunit [Gammaproteobacteria bacterium]NIN61347.1 glutamine-hydrolyzing carbamoyl-phosphate synthase small subunit [Gammaproteobacteria bacterium]NIO61114.1 glutamine-hydrolyzing carbamoyl-phosphate synthase small subunit [Gammaproteobacteria bacterium]NIP48952.1 glutamine-hydrolyzing carbamoyl-phosphate synthase small subunit [Gammaproteobacteria bacterium]NIQ09406.1 glutamine-hydrolyzing carbamoyl-phosphate synthase small subunit [Ga